jgi:hypothetical protein
VISDEDKIKTVHTFHTQVLSAVLDHKETEFFDLIENFFSQRSKVNYRAGYQAGYDEALRQLGILPDVQ